MNKILVVEDDRLLLKLYATKLIEEGYQVWSAGNGMEGYHTAKEVMPELILLDILMPKVDGYGMLKLLRDDAKTKEVPVMILTNTPSLPDARGAQKMGVVKAMFKAEVTPRVLAGVVKEFFQTRSTQD